MKIFIENIIQDDVKDVLVSGYIDSETPSVFHPMYERIYIVMNDDILELYIDDGVVFYNELKKIKEWFEVDEDDKFSLMSIYSQLFKTEQEIKITQVSYRSVPFSAIAINYKEGDNERRLFLDPNNFFGFTYYN